MSVIPRHSILRGTEPPISILRVGELAINTADKAIWASDGEDLIRLNGAARLDQLENFSPDFENINALQGNTIIQWDNADQEYKPTLKIQLGAGAVSKGAGLNEGVAIGRNALAEPSCVAIGSNSMALSGIAIRGRAGVGSIVIGDSDISSAINAVVIGDNNLEAQPNLVSVGHGCGGKANSVVIGFNTTSTAGGAVIIGHGASGGGITIGPGGSSVADSIAIGGSTAAAGAVGIGGSANALHCVQLGDGTNGQAETLKFRNTTVANAVSIQIKEALNYDEIAAIEVMPPNGTLIMDDDQGILYMARRGGWVAAATAAFDPSVITLGTLSNLQSSGQNKVDGMTSQQGGFILMWNGSTLKWESSGVIDCGTY